MTLGIQNAMRILLVVDFSYESTVAVVNLATQVWPAGTVVRVLSVFENLPPSAAELWFDAEGSLEAVLEERKKRAEALVLRAADLLLLEGLTVEMAVLIGRRRKVVAQERKAWHAELVISNHFVPPGHSKGDK